MPFVAALASAWVAWRWLGFALGLLRIDSFPDGPVRREARRTVITRGALNLALSIGLIYLWGYALHLQIAETFVGLLAAWVVIALATAAVARLMQPSVRIPHTISICHVIGSTPDTPVRPVGKVFTTDPSGTYAIDLVDEIKPPWDEAVRAYVDEMTAKFGENLHSVYVRGSIAKGTTINGFSDLDGGVVTVEEAPRDREWLESLDAKFERFPFVAGIEVLTIPRAALFEDDARNHLAFIVSTGAICVHGDDVRDELPRFGFGPWAFSHSRGLGQNIDEYLGLARVEQDADERRDLCGWIMRRIVRAGFESVMAEEGTYTRDLFCAYEAFRRHNPDLADEMWRALELAVVPTDDIDEPSRICEGIGRKVAGLGAAAYERASAAAD